MKVLLILVLGLVLVSCEETQRIVNGKNATEGQFPFHVQVRSINFLGFQSLCGGTLISSEFVLTAGEFSYRISGNQFE
jgi:secreted trypsin-like serine protease